MKQSQWIFALFILAGCSSEPKAPKLEPAEEAAVEAKIQQDQLAMDSLEKAIMEAMQDTTP